MTTQRSRLGIAFHLDKDRQRVQRVLDDTPGSIGSPTSSTDSGRCRCRCRIDRVGSTNQLTLESHLSGSSTHIRRHHLADIVRTTRRDGECGGDRLLRRCEDWATVTFCRRPFGSVACTFDSPYESFAFYRSKVDARLIYLFTNSREIQ